MQFNTYRRMLSAFHEASHVVVGCRVGIPTVRVTCLYEKERGRNRGGFTQVEDIPAAFLYSPPLSRAGKK
jgi:hypothetical protein